MVNETKPIKILCVEDNPLIALVTRKMLLKLGYQADTAVSGNEALAKYSTDYDLILMDIDLPDMTGIDVVEKISPNKNDLKQPPIVAYTAYDDEKTKSKCLEVGMEEVIHKPTSIEILKKTILKYLKH